VAGGAALVLGGADGSDGTDGADEDGAGDEVVVGRGDGAGGVGRPESAAGLPQPASTSTQDNASSDRRHEPGTALTLPQRGPR
jgi:hypothetical protein